MAEILREHSDSLGSFLLWYVSTSKNEEPPIDEPDTQCLRLS
ncbi:hypothetical protein [Rickettsiella endosymbiont of Dermanyssus gallinae]|nr:hypothetical protein [Rickettsiella endosymbiont of Dermanyssus gallinae]